MEIIEVDKKEFKSIFINPYYIFGSADFNDLNKYKCDTVYYLIFKDKKYRLGIIGGIKDNLFWSSFSAPFGSFVTLKNNISINHIDNAIDLLVEWAKVKKFVAIRIALPPLFYNNDFITNQINSFYRKGFDVLRIELNYAIFYENFGGNYIDNINSNGRNNLRKALKSNLSFNKCESREEKRKAYAIIKKHKKVKNYPIHLSWEQILETIKIINADFFIVSNADEIQIASAMVFHVNQSVVQIIYWGDVLDYEYIRPMNFLAFKIFEYYKNKKIKVIDLGISSEDSIPNVGLGDFKQSIGCDIGPKMCFEKILQQSSLNEVSTVIQQKTTKMIHHTSDVQTKNIGENTQVWQFCVILPGAIIGKNCNVNCNVFIENDVFVGNNVTIKSGVQVWDGVTMENNVFIGPNVTFTNDLFPRSKQNIRPFLKTIIKKGASIGANATILAGVTIGRYVMIGAGSVVTKSIPDFHLWVGNPAKQVGYVTKKGEILDLKLKAKWSGRQFEFIENELKEIKNHYAIEAEGIRIRFIEPADAQFVIGIRTDRKLKKFISPTSDDIDTQTKWIKGYEEREANKREIYFIIEDPDKKPWGTIRLYNILSNSFTIGSWICMAGNTDNIAIKAHLLAIEFGFEKLNIQTCLLDVRKKNIRVLNYLKLFNPAKIDESSLNYYFSLDKETYYKNRKKIIKFFKLKF